MDFLLSAAKGFSDKISTPLILGGGAAYLTYVGTHEAINAIPPARKEQIKFITCASMGLAIALTLQGDAATSAVAWLLSSGAAYASLNFGGDVLQSTVALMAALGTGLVTVSATAGLGFVGSFFSTAKKMEKARVKPIEPIHREQFVAR